VWLAVALQVRQVAAIKGHEIIFDWRALSPPGKSEKKSRFWSRIGTRPRLMSGMLNFSLPPPPALSCTSSYSP
jgi:hypothetical protein